MKTEVTATLEQTQALARELAKEIAGRHTVVTLKGELGSGKTTFAKAFVEATGVLQQIVSPTYVLMNQYQTPTQQQLYHLDLYRLEDLKEVLDIGIKEILSEANAIVLIEWPEKIETFLPAETISVQFEVLNETTRKITVN